MTHEPFPAPDIYGVVEKDALLLSSSYSSESSLSSYNASSYNVRQKRPHNSSSNVFARRSQVNKKRKTFAGSMEKYIRRNSRDTAFQKPRSTVSTTTTTTTLATKEQVCPNKMSRTTTSKYFSSSSSATGPPLSPPQQQQSSTQKMLLQSLKSLKQQQQQQYSNQLNVSTKTVHETNGSATQRILSRVTSSTMQSDSIGKRFDPISTRSTSTFDRFHYSRSSESNNKTTNSNNNNNKGLSRFSRKKEDSQQKDVITQSQREDFKMTTTLMRSPDRIVHATSVNLLEDTSFDSLESPAQVIPETPPRSCKKVVKNEKLKQSFAFRLSKFTFNNANTSTSNKKN